MTEKKVNVDTHEEETETILEESEENTQLEDPKVGDDYQGEEYIQEEGSDANVNREVENNNEDVTTDIPNIMTDILHTKSQTQKDTK